jgi:hypothetical protein
LDGFVVEHYQGNISSREKYEKCIKNCYFIENHRRTNWKTRSISYNFWKNDRWSIELIYFEKLGDYRQCMLFILNMRSVQTIILRYIIGETKKGFKRDLNVSWEQYEELLSNGIYYIEAKDVYMVELKHIHQFLKN